MKILITGATDGIGLGTARKLKSLGHELLLHGRSEEKLARIKEELHSETYRADFSKLEEVKAFANEVKDKHSSIDVLLNNAGVFKLPDPSQSGGLDVRFVVNTFAPYLLTKLLLPSISEKGKIINIASAAQKSVDLEVLKGKKQVAEFEAYSQSKLGIAMWSRLLAKEIAGNGPAVIAVNPGSYLATKMVTEGFGLKKGHDIKLGVDILCKLITEDQYFEYSGQYFDNDRREFSSPHEDGLNDQLCEQVRQAMDEIVKAQL